MSIWESSEYLREHGTVGFGSRRKDKRYAYDCIHLKFNSDRCKCEHGRKLSMSKDGSITAKKILSGVTPTVCKQCSLFEFDRASIFK